MCVTKISIELGKHWMQSQSSPDRASDGTNADTCAVSPILEGRIVWEMIKVQQSSLNIRAYSLPTSDCMDRQGDEFVVNTKDHNGLLIKL